MQQSDVKERVMVKKDKKLKKNDFARGLMDTTKHLLHQEQEKVISVNEKPKLDYPSPDFWVIQSGEK